MNGDVPWPSRRMLVRVALVVAALLICVGASAARAVAHGSRPVVRVAAPCASQGSCKYCAPGGVGTGQCTTSKLEFNVAWCGRNKHHLSKGNKAKCKAEARYLSWGPPDQLLPWINIVCAPPNARTIYLVVKGLVSKTGPVGVACAGISVYAGLHSLILKIL